MVQQFISISDLMLLQDSSDIKLCFHNFSWLPKVKLQGFPRLKKHVFKDFPGYTPFTNMNAWGQKLYIPNQFLPLAVWDVCSRLVCFQSTSTSRDIAQYALYKLMTYLLTVNMHTSNTCGCINVLQSTQNWPKRWQNAENELQWISSLGSDTWTRK